MSAIKFSGLASGIDSGALIDSIIQARDVQNQIRRNEISYLESSNDALTELNTKLLALNDLIDKFRTVNGGGIQKKASSSDSAVVTALAGSNAANSSFSITTSSVANTATASFNQAYGSLNDFYSTD